MRYIPWAFSHQHIEWSTNCKIMLLWRGSRYISYTFKNWKTFLLLTFSVVVNLIHACVTGRENAIDQTGIRTWASRISSQVFYQLNWLLVIESIWPPVLPPFNNYCLHPSRHTTQSRFLWPWQEFHLQVQRWLKAPNITGREKLQLTRLKFEPGAVHQPLELTGPEKTSKREDI